MSKIEIHNNSITKVHTEAIVNAANSALRQGGGVCGAVFQAAGAAELAAECKKHGHCAVGSAVITSACRLQETNHTKYIIHAVGPDCRVTAENANRAKLLYGAYSASLALARDYGCKSVTFPLISSGIFNYPVEEAWKVALKACREFIAGNPAFDITIVFVGTNQEVVNTGKTIYKAMSETAAAAPSAAPEYLFFWKHDEENGCFSNWYSAPFTVEGIQYCCVEQYMMAKKALTFGDLPMYGQIMQVTDPKQIKALGKLVHNYISAVWNGCKEEIVYNACYAKFSQNVALKQALLLTGEKILAEASPKDDIWGIGLTAEAAAVTDQSQWPGQGLLGKILMQVRTELK